MTIRSYVCQVIALFFAYLFIAGVVLKGLRTYGNLWVIDAQSYCYSCYHLIESDRSGVSLIIGIGIFALIALLIGLERMDS